MKKTQPTHAQFGGLREDAIAAEIERETVQALIDSNEILDLMKKRQKQIIADRENCITFELAATVQQDRPYEEALEVAAPDTPSNYNARRVGGVYPPITSGKEKVNFILRNFPKGGGSWDKAQEWAKAKGYKPANSREVFAVAEQHSLRKLLDRSLLYLVATTDCAFGGGRQAVCVEMGGSLRLALLSWVSGFVDDDGWFLFRK